MQLNSFELRPDSRPAMQLNSFVTGWKQRVTKFRQGASLHLGNISSVFAMTAAWEFEVNYECVHLDTWGRNFELRPASRSSVQLTSFVKVPRCALAKILSDESKNLDLSFFGFL